MRHDDDYSGYLGGGDRLCHPASGLETINASKEAQESKMKKVLFGALALGVVVLAAPASAATTADVGVSATVVSSCSITALPVEFGNYDALSATADDATGSVSVSCSVGSNPKIWLGQGLYAGGGSTDAVPVRRMANGANRLSYQLFQESGRTTIWGATDPSSPAAVTANDLDPVTSTIYGRIPINQLSTVGAYADTVLATVNF
ncbi:MAG TPA: spore coat U domain-containing protein [Thermoanaerobaculia bacterium]|nr:spore coat U domain-containing protein [Thermoanaerobaculia bacterium]